MRAAPHPPGGSGAPEYDAFRLSRLWTLPRNAVPASPPAGHVRLDSKRNSTRRRRYSTTGSCASWTTWATTGQSCRRPRVSYGRGTRRARDDENLIRYLMRHRHSTPFEMCEIKLHVKLPIFVARQWIRHRTANVNEYSARYSVLAREFYVPELADVAPQAGGNRQGRAEPLAIDAAEAARSLLRSSSERAFDSYERLLAPSAGSAAEPAGPGVARELARIAVPLSTYTEWYWKTDLHNLLHFIELRSSTNAQREICAYAEAIAKIVAVWMPMTWRAFADYRLQGKAFSGTALAVLRRMLRGEEVTAEDGGDVCRRVARVSGGAEAAGREGRRFVAQFRRRARRIFEDHVSLFQRVPTAAPIRFQRPVTLVGAGDAGRRAVDLARRVAPDVVAADGGADKLRAWRLGLRAVVGDMDSVADLHYWRARGAVVRSRVGPESNRSGEMPPGGRCAALRRRRFPRRSSRP